MGPLFDRMRQVNEDVRYGGPTDRFVDRLHEVFLSHIPSMAQECCGQRAFEHRISCWSALRGKPRLCCLGTMSDTGGCCWRG